MCEHDSLNCNGYEKGLLVPDHDTHFLQMSYQVRREKISKPLFPK